MVSTFAHWAIFCPLWASFLSSFLGPYCLSSLSSGLQAHGILQHFKVASSHPPALPASPQFSPRSLTRSLYPAGLEACLLCTPTSLTPHSCDFSFPASRSRSVEAHFIPSVGMPPGLLTSFSYLSTLMAALTSGAGSLPLAPPFSIPSLPFKLCFQRITLPAIV